MMTLLFKYNNVNMLPKTFYKSFFDMILYAMHSGYNLKLSSQAISDLIIMMNELLTRMCHTWSDYDQDYNITIDDLKVCIQHHVKEELTEPVLTALNNVPNFNCNDVWHPPVRYIQLYEPYDEDEYIDMQKSFFLGDYHLLTKLKKTLNIKAHINFNIEVALKMVIFNLMLELIGTSVNITKENKCIFIKTKHIKDALENDKSLKETFVMTPTMLALP